MTERPILFSAPMVRALLAGTKTQTRRMVKPCKDLSVGCELAACELAGEVNAGDYSNAKYRPGDRLWVRETCIAEELPDGLDGVRYLADEAFIPIQSTSEAADRWLDLRFYGKRQSPVAPVKTVPAIHMPRWASRITLEVTGVRVERLQDISEADALAEGISRLAPPAPPHEWSGLNRFTLNGMGSGFCAGSVSWNSPTAEALYLRLWEDINGPGSWEANPWVWVVEFKWVQP